MHYYQFNIGDYSSHTNHLDPIEDIAYRRMLDWCYIHETPLPQDVESISRLIRMREYGSAIRDVLNEFFEQTGEGWFSSRVQREIEHYHSKIEHASKAGKASAERRFNNRLTGDELTNNQEPVTINQKQKKEKSAIALPPEAVSESVWSDFVALRKAKKAVLTNTAINGIQREAKKAGVTLEQALQMCCERGWTGFRAEWVSGQAIRVSNPRDVANITTPTPANYDAALKKIEQDSKNAAPMPAHIREKLNQLKKV